ncbi:mucin-5AC-like [Hyalella azteca]|uniref:Mucin-5AC-like n=1 Tax=Hyalella azteca TaxID=294128 RepID=A0A979FP90_HYAAZ|nr:mucin-5AC-like [Hyalella azteca]
MTEYVAYGELYQLWQSLVTLPDNLVALYVAEIAVTIDFLHNAGVIYRDLKMENLLLDEDGHIKLIDFGLAKWLRYGSKTGSICGTLHLMAPEVCAGSWYGHSVDWWSLGIIAYCLVVGRYPVPLQLNHASMMHAISKCNYSLPEGTNPDLESLIKGLLNRDPKERIHSLVQLQREPLYADTDLSTITRKKVAPRKLLEEYIEKKTRQNFEDFAGLTSTPKHCQKSGTSSELCSSPGIDRAGVSSPASHRGSRISLGFHKRSASSPLLHPGRLGHHDTALKCGGSVAHSNGASVPILQSPLLRLARQHCINQASVRYSKSPKVLPRSHAHSYVNITTLSSPSPSLLRSQKIKDRKQRFRGSKKQPSLPTLHQENSSFDSMRMSNSINEIPSCLEGSSSSTSCEKLFCSHSLNANESSNSSSQKSQFVRPRSADLSSSKIITSKSFCVGGQGKSTSPSAGSPVLSRVCGVPFVNTLPPIACSPYPPSSPNPSSSPLFFSSPAPSAQPMYGSSLLPPPNPSAHFFSASTSLSPAPQLPENGDVSSGSRDTSKGIAHDSACDVIARGPTLVVHDDDGVKNENDSVLTSLRNFQLVSKWSLENPSASCSNFQQEKGSFDGECVNTDKARGSDELITESILLPSESSMCLPVSPTVSGVVPSADVSRLDRDLCSQSSGTLPVVTTSEFSATIVPSVLVSPTSCAVTINDSSYSGFSATNFVTTDNSSSFISTASIDDAAESSPLRFIESSSQEAQLAPTSHARCASLSSSNTVGFASKVSDKSMNSSSISNHRRIASSSDFTTAKSTDIEASFEADSRVGTVDIKNSTSLRLGRKPNFGYVLPRFHDKESEVSDSASSRAAIKEKLAHFQDSLDRITAFQKDLQPYEPPTSTGVSTPFPSLTKTDFATSQPPSQSLPLSLNSSILVSSKEIASAPSTLALTSACSSSILAPGSAPLNDENSEVSNSRKIRTSPVTYCRTKATSQSSSLTNSSQTTLSSPRLSRAASIRTSPHFRYRHNIRDSTSRVDLESSFAPSPAGNTASDVKKPESSSSMSDPSRGNIHLNDDTHKNSSDLLSSPKCSRSVNSTSSLVSSSSHTTLSPKATSPQSLSFPETKSAQDLRQVAASAAVSSSPRFLINHVQVSNTDGYFVPSSNILTNNSDSSVISSNMIASSDSLALVGTKSVFTEDSHGAGDEKNANIDFFNKNNNNYSIRQ